MKHHVLFLGLTALFTSGLQAASWRDDAVMLVTDEPLMLGTYVRPEGSASVSGSLLEDVMICGVERFEVVNRTDITDGGVFFVVIPNDKGLPLVESCLRKRLPFEVSFKKYLPTEDKF